MAERTASRTGAPHQGDAGDPFAELTRIIGFDPRVKVSKAAAPDAPAAVPSAAPADRPEQAEPFDDTADWEVEFANVDFDLAVSAESAGPVGLASPRSEAAASPATRAETSGEGARRAAQPDPASFAVAGSVEDITEAFEREWHAKASWAPAAEDAPVSAQPSPAGRAAGQHPASPETVQRSAADVDTLFGEELDDVLAASIELDLDADWLTDTADASDPGPRDEAPAEAGPAPVHEHAARTAAPDPDDFEAELAALLSAQSAVPAGKASTPPAPAVADRSARAEAAPLLPERSDAAPAAAPSRADPAAAANERVAEAPATPPAAETGEDDDPFAALAAMAARYRAAQSAPKRETAATPAQVPPTQAPQDASTPTNAPEVEEMKRPSSERFATPDIETVDLPEYPMTLADDLDIPANPYGSSDEAPPASRRHHAGYDDEFDDLLQEMSTGEPVRAPNPATRAASYAPMPAHRAAPRPAMPRAATIPEGRQQPGPAAGRPADADWDDYEASAQTAEHYGYDDRGYDDESQEPAAPKPQRKRGGWFAALFGSVAVIAAGGAYALKFTGVAENGGPTLVKADAGPMKVRPENPGGLVVPNQENQVYDRVAGVGTAAAPQEKLLSSTEEPMSLDEPEGESADDTLPGLELSGDDMDAEPDGKADDRLDAAEQADDPDEAPAIAVAPRKVRTMVVKPDGTLAAREEPAPAVQALAANAADAIDTVKRNSMAADVDRTDSTASVTPSTDDAAASPASAGDVAAAQPAVMQADGEWAVQIASQPSEAAARSSYADLAKRYANVLANRPAAIVKADVAGKGTFWRVRLAAEDRSEAASICADYKAAGGNCFVTK